MDRPRDVWVQMLYLFVKMLHEKKKKAKQGDSD